MKSIQLFLTFVLSMSSTLFFAQQKTKQFDFTGKVQEFKVPNGCTSIEVEMAGGSGGWSIWEGKQYDYYIPGKAGILTATYPVTPGETIYIYVGGKGEDAIADQPGKGGFNGGGSGNTSEPGYGPYTGGGGGGASDIRIGGKDISNRVLVVGGAGGAGSNYPDTGGDNGGHGGGLEGTDGQSNSTDDVSVGRGGTQRSGGEGGQWSGYDKAEDGKLGQGGSGPKNTSGGGGGGGYYGGGAGCWSGGGGGSSYSDSRAKNVKHKQGEHEGDGYVIIKYSEKSAPRNCDDFVVTATTSKTVICEGESLALFGNGGEHYTWSDGVVDQQAFNPPAGIHTYKLEGKSEDGQCSATDEITIVVNKLELAPSISYNEVTGLGIVDVEIKGTGLAPYNYNWAGSSSENGHFDNLKTGTYPLTVTDAIGCKVTTSVSIDQHEPIDLDNGNHNSGHNYALTAQTNEDQSFVTISYKGAFEFQIVDKNDRVVKNGNAIESTEVDISRLKPGTYTVQLIYKQVKEEVSFVKY